MSERVRFLAQWLSRYSFHCALFMAASAAAVWMALNIGVLGEIHQGYFSSNVQRETELDYVAGLLWWSLLAVTLWLLGGADRQHLLIAWTAKFFVVLVEMLFYEYRYRYNLDTFAYFNTVVTGQHEFFAGVDWFRESWIPTLKETIQADAMEEKLIQSAGTENMLRILLIISQITGPYFHALKVVYAFLGFIGTWFVYRAVVVILGRPFLPAFYGLMLYPSMLFWSSILGKDPLSLLFIGFYIYGGTLWLVHTSPRGLAWVALAFLGSYLFRPWTAAIEMVAFLLATSVKVFGFAPVVLASLVLIVGLVFETDISGSVRLIEINAFLEDLATKAEAQTEGSGSGAGLDLAEAQELVSSPHGILIILFSGLFRPLPFDVTNMLVAVAAVENSVLLVLALIAVKRLRWTYCRQPVLLWTLTYTLIWAGVYGLVICANFGTGMRYKLQVLPFIVLFLFLLLNREGRAALDRMGERETPQAGALPAEKLA